MTAASRNGGYSLVELMISLALTGIVMAMTMPVAHVQKRLWERAEEQREAGRAMAGALFWLTRDLQQAGYHASGSTLLRASDSLTYVLSRDEENPAHFSAENRRLITVWADDGDLKYRIQAPLPPPASGWESGSTQVLASGIETLSCSGFDAGGVETEQASRATLVACTVTTTAGGRERMVVRLRLGAGASGP